MLYNNDNIADMKNAPSENLFAEIVKHGVGYINDAIADKTIENYYLDFKTTEEQDYAGKRKLLASDKKNYAKAISAFGNSDGGIVVWGVKTGTSDADYAVGKVPIKNVSNFASLLEGFTSLLTTPPHTNVSNKIIFEDEKTDTGYVVTHIPKSNRRPFQVLNENDFRYYIRAGSNSLPASDTFLRSLFGQEPQPEVIIVFGTPPVKMDDAETISIQIGIILHNKGENVAKNLNGYVHVGGRGIEFQINTPNEFSYNKNSIAGLKIGFVAKPDFILGVEQEVQPLTITIRIKKPVTENGIQIFGLVNCDNQVSCRFDKEVTKEGLEKAYDQYIKDTSFNIVGAIIGKGDEEIAP